MSKYVKPVIEAFWAGKTKKIKNTRTEGFKLYLWDNCIAWIDFNEDLWIDSCGWKTITTKDRLSMIGVFIEQRKGIWYIKEKEWDGKAILLDKFLNEKEK